MGLVDAILILVHSRDSGITIVLPPLLCAVAGFNTPAT